MWPSFKEIILNVSVEEVLEQAKPAQSIFNSEDMPRACHEVLAVGSIQLLCELIGREAYRKFVLTDWWGEARMWGRKR
jgi:hypothetical protein